MRLYACIISPDAKRDRDALLSVAQQFSHSIELLDDGVLFDVSGLQNLIGPPDKISQKILAAMKKNSVSGSIAVADTIETAMLLARRESISSNPQSAIRNPQSYVASPDNFAQLPLEHLLIDEDTKRVFSDLGIKSIRDLQQIPEDELIRRYGQQFKNVIDVIQQKDGRLLTPNIKENNVSWDYNLDFPVDDFEQLIFILNHGLDRLMDQTSHHGYSTEQLDLCFTLQDKTERTYEIKTSFPTLEKTFWLKLINLRVSLDPPESEIVAIRVTLHFTPPRPAQAGLYAVSRPDPERLLLTVNKLKKLVGEDNVGIPVLLDQRIEKAFTLNAEAIPKGEEVAAPKNGSVSKNAATREEVNQDMKPKQFPQGKTVEPQQIQNPKSEIRNSTIAFSYFNPPIPADVLVREKRLVFLRTQYFSGHVTKYSGVWKANSKWWDKSWKAQEWDVEIENHGVYRLSRVNSDWFLVGEYD